MTQAAAPHRHPHLMIPTRRSIVLALVAAVLAPPAVAGEGLRALEAFLANVQQGRASFTQTVTAPGRDGQPPRVRTSRGEFSFLRPDRFRFHYTHPFEQDIVADGQTLWLHDPDLNQVTARRQAEALAHTPAALLAAAADLRALRQAFELREGEPREGLHWVEATPTSRDGAIQRIAVGFRDGRLEVLEVLDGFGQRSVLRFGPLQTAGVTAAQFRFQPPPGVEVVRP